MGKGQMFTGANPGFQVRGGALKKFAPSRGRRENFWGFRVKNHDFTPHEIYTLDINLHQHSKSLTRKIPVVLLCLFYKGTSSEEFDDALSAV